MLRSVLWRISAFGALALTGMCVDRVRQVLAAVLAIPRELARFVVMRTMEMLDHFGTSFLP